MMPQSADSCKKNAGASMHVLHTDIACDEWIIDSEISHHIAHYV